jgi:DNA-binding NtrC family response regulator
VEVVDGPDAGKSAMAQSETFVVGTAEDNDLVLSDPTVSRYHVELEATAEGVMVVDHRSTNGTVVNGVGVRRCVVTPGSTLSLGNTRVRVVDGEGGTVELLAGEKLGDLRGRSRAMRQLMAQVEKAAKSEVPALIVGESGTGKELIARALHDLGPRASGPFEVVDCGALAPNLVASELFGHERGAFTGADKRRIGAFERAKGGTLFLDEIGELPSELQPALLGVLERRQLRRVGGQEAIPIDVRVVSATHRDLRAEVNTNRFRLDLYYRLAVVTLRVAPLRDRAEDIPLLIEHFLREAGHDGRVSEVFPHETIEKLMAHDWPGNARELRNVVDATLAMGEAPTFAADSPEVGDSADGDPHAIPLARALRLPYKRARAMVLEAFEARYIRHILDEAEGNVARAARNARMDRSYLFSLLKRHDLR